MKSKKYYARKVLRIVLFVLINIYLFHEAKRVYFETGTIPDGVHLKNVICISMLYVVFYLMVIYFIITSINIKTLASRGLKTEATIISQYSSSKLQHIKYQYTDNEENTHIKRYGIDKKQYKLFHDKGYIKNNHFEIMYDPLKPKRCYPTYVIEKFYS